MDLITRQKRYAELTALGAQHDLAFLLDRVGLHALVAERFKSADPTTPARSGTRTHVPSGGAGVAWALARS